MEGHYHSYHYITPHQQQLHCGSVAVDLPANRLTQWSLQETKEFLMIRAQFDQRFMETRRNKLLWEVISNKMKEMGYNRSPEQCKFKWKNLVTRYKVSNRNMDSFTNRTPLIPRSNLAVYKSCGCEYQLNS